MVIQRGVRGVFAAGEFDGAAIVGNANEKPLEDRF
jgi:hypothetical protein